MKQILYILILMTISFTAEAQVVQQASPTRTFNYQGGVGVDSFFRVPSRIPKGWMYNIDSTGTLGFDRLDRSLKMNDGLRVVKLLSEKDTVMIKNYINSNPKVTIVWDSVKNKPAIIDTIEAKFSHYWTKDSADARYLNQYRDTIIETHKIFKQQTSSVLTLDYTPLSTCHLIFKLNNVDVAPEDMVVDWLNKKVTATFPILYEDYIAIYYSYKQN